MKIALKILFYAACIAAGIYIGLHINDWRGIS